MNVYRKLFADPGCRRCGCSGQAVTEYAVILASVSLAGIVLLSLLGSKVQGIFSSAAGNAAECAGAVYTVSYDACGGSGAPGSQSAEPGTDVVLSETVPVRSGFEFLGWAEDAAAEEAQYRPGDSCTVSGDITLHALWKAQTFTLSSSGNGYFSGDAFIDGPRVVQANVSLSSSPGTDTVSWECSFSLASMVYSGDKGGFSGVLSIGGRSFPVGEQGVTEKLRSAQIPVSLTSGSAEIEGLMSDPDNLAWALTGQVTMYNNGSLHRVSESDMAIDVSLSGVLERD